MARRSKLKINLKPESKEVIEIKLPGGYVALIDAEDYPKVSTHKWDVVHKKGTLLKYAHRMISNGDKPRIHQMMHRVILGLEDKSLVVDHINGNALDNRKSNLRVCDLSQNQWNSKRRKDSTSRYRGVRKQISGKYESRISVRNKKIYLGVFDYEKDAAEAYNEGAKKYHGEFAKLNII